MNGTFPLKFICSLLITITPSLSKLIYSSNFLLNSLVFSTHRIVSSLNKDGLTSSIPVGDFFFLSYCSWSNTVLPRRQKSTYLPCSHFKGKALVSDFSWVCFIRKRIFLFIPNRPQGFFVCVWIVKSFSMSLRYSYVFCLEFYSHALISSDYHNRITTHWSFSDLKTKFISLHFWRLEIKSKVLANSGLLVRTVPSL